MKSYRSFLMGLGREMFDMLRECENMGFHHYHEGSPEFAHYLRLITWLDELGERLAYYDDVKAKNRPPVRTRTTAKSVVDRYLAERNDRDSHAGQRGLDGNAESILEARINLDPDNSGHGNKG